ncbi:hypothetical protein C1645_827259 [Glomus cerebriforme]|uniref:Uncharacterized protein n=1 Tax=Glomus cerebriforme TaxID=658196 RepID=A0A397SVA7_9GLOM|nr:hypothetical protein C1645_827259 [Glomus cerebriforme]
MGGRSSNGSSPVDLSIFSPILESGKRFSEQNGKGNGSLSSLVQNGIRNGSLYFWIST